MAKKLRIDPDDIEGLSDALREALMRKGIFIPNDFINEYLEELEEDVDFLSYKHGPIDTSNCGYDDPEILNGLTIDNDDEPFAIGGCGVIPGSCGMRTYGSCGQPSSPSYGGCGGGCGYTPSYGGCGNSHC